MTVSEAIDQVLRRTDNVTEGEGDYDERRQRHLEYLRETFQEIWWLNDHQFRRTSASVVMPTGAGTIEVPSRSLGTYGGIYLNRVAHGVGRQLEEVPEQVIFDLRASNYSTTEPDCFAFSGFTGAPTYLPRIITALNSGPVTFDVYYLLDPPTLDEGTNNESLKLLPEKYHQTVLIPGMRAKARESTSDNRWQTSLQEFEKAKVWFLREERRFQGTFRQLPSFFGQRAGYRH